MTPKLVARKSAITYSKSELLKIVVKSLTTYSSFMGHFAFYIVSERETLCWRGVCHLNFNECLFLSAYQMFQMLFALLIIAATAVMQFKDLTYVIKSVWSFTLCSAVFRWCWTAQPCPVCFTSSAVLKSPFAKRHAGPSQTSQQETEHKYRYHTLSSFLSYN